MVTLSNDFESNLRAALVADIEAKTVDEPGNLAFQVLDAIGENLREYAAEHDYDADAAIESIAVTSVDRRANGISVTIESDHPLVLFAQTGTSDHTIQGNPILAFEFDAGEYPGLAEQFPEGTAFLHEVEVSGLPEGRVITDALEFFELLLTGSARRGVGA